MPKSPMHPGLQGKFERALVEIIPPDERLSGPAIFDALKSRRDEFEIRDDELEHLDATFPNYIARAKNNGLVESHGRRRGYSIAAPLGLGTTGTAARDEATGIAEPTRNQQWESFLHLPLSVALASRFDAHVVSLPAVTGPVRWGNPDMLMVRQTDRIRVRQTHAALDPEVFRTVDARPDYILSALEVKYGLRANRANLFTAVSEAAANSGWANEGWLAFYEPTHSAEAMPADVLSLAQSVGIGILEVVVTDGAEEPELESRIHLAAMQRTSLRLDEVSQRGEMLLEAQGALRDFQGQDETLLDRTPTERLRDSLHRALLNLGRQRGFLSDPKGYPTFGEIECWRGMDEVGHKRFKQLARATVLSLVSDSSLATGNVPVPEVVRTAMSDIRDSRAALAELGRALNELLGKADFEQDADGRLDPGSIGQ